MDLYILAMIAGVVAVLTFVLYLCDRSSKQQPVEWLDAGKIALSAGGVASGVAYAVGSEVSRDSRCCSSRYVCRQT